MLDKELQDVADFFSRHNAYGLAWESFRRIKTALKESPATPTNTPKQSAAQIAAELCSIACVCDQYLHEDYGNRLRECARQLQLG